ncbi:phage/plasmid primase, P4 family [Ruminococcus sp. RTP21484sp1_RTP31023st1_H8_RTP31023_210422]|uniref:phage/plasmid primase, P4 family n=1 Tax=Ruminococcus sp. RTP21484sp1_RTP31023st1_H8_RTP31023_210422 TaxID=3141611 RepID=UPI0034A4A42B
MVSIRAVADYLGLEEEYGKRKFPGERTASIQLYKDNRFHDFGRNVNGDIFDLMIHVRGCTLKEAIAELKTAFNIKDSPIRENVVKEAWIAYLERKFNAKYIEHYDYFLIDQSGKAVYAYTKVRLQDKTGKKKLVYGRFNGDRFILGLQGKKAKDIPAIYGSSIRKIQEAIEHQKTIFYVEGEKDTNTLMRKGYTVFTCGGSGDWKKSVSEIVRQANVIILADNDEPGEQLAYQVMQDLQLISNSVSIIKPMPNVDKADITDYFEEGHSVEEFEDLIKNDDGRDTVSILRKYGETKKSEKEKKTRTGEKSKKDCLVLKRGSEDILKQLITLNAAECFQMNDRGSADLFATIFKNISRYNPTKKDWMYYDKTRWTADTEGMRAKRNAKTLADVLVRYSVTASLPDDKRQSYIKYAAGMMNYRNRNVMITDAKDLNFFENIELDKDDFFLNCKNCVLDLSGDQPKALEHNADLLLSKICNASYNPVATCTLWEKTVNEIMQGDSSKIEYLQKMSGRFLTGDTSEEEFYIFFGATTRNGKSTITELLLYLLGDYATTISPESLAIKANKDSRTASPDIAKLAGTRLVVASEPPRRMLFDSSLVKTLTGRDSISARFLHENEFQFKPKFKLILNSNYLPVINDKTVFSSNRVKVIPFERHFAEKEQNKHLKEQLQQEIDGILNWCIEGLYMYRKEGLEPPEAVRTATHEYGEDSDKTGKFISECLVRSEHNLAAKDVYEKYSQWCNDCGLGIDGRTSFYEELKTKNLLSKTGTVAGKTVKNVIKGYSFVDEIFHPVDGNSKVPFP